MLAAGLAMAVILSPASRAGQEETGSAPRASANGAARASVGDTEQLSPTMSDCAKEGRFVNRKSCWTLIERGFRQLFALHLREVDGAAPGRFFPATVSFTKSGMDADGRFLQVFCLDAEGQRRPCRAQASVLERRIVEMTLVESLPVQKPPLYALRDPWSWVVTPRAQELIDETKGVYPDLLSRVDRLIRSVVTEHGKRGPARSEPGASSTAPDDFGTRIKGMPAPDDVK